MIRIGHGFDVHSLVSGRALILGGVEIPGVEAGLLGHSDADVLIHAVADAFLGAVAGGDIGIWFPDDDPEYQGADSGGLLRKIIKAEPWRDCRLINMDCTIMAEKPRLADYIPGMRNNLAHLFEVDKSMVSVKATTCEKLGFVGREEGIAATAVLLLDWSDDIG